MSPIENIWDMLKRRVYARVNPPPPEQFGLAPTSVD